MTNVANAHERRKSIQVRARSIGIDDAYVSLLVDTFYERILAHPIIGPIFDDEIGDNWSLHLSTMKDFWASVAYNAGRYSGKPIPVHVRLEGVERWHFGIWLALFEEALNDTAGHPDVIAYFMIRARRIAANLEKAMFQSERTTEA